MESDKPLILSFDTSAAQCAAALVSDETILSAKSETMTKGQAERLLPMLEEVLAEAGKGWQDVTRLAVCTGPGNFTGVRIAVAAARGLALALNIPATGVSTFEVLAHGRKGAVTVALDGRREQVFLQDFRNGAASGEPRKINVPEIMQADCYIGYMADQFAERLGGLSFGEETLADPVKVARCAAGKPESDIRPAPLYLRAADAALPADPPPVIFP